MILTKKYIQENKDKFVLENVTEKQFSQNSIDLSLGKYIFIDKKSVFYPMSYEDLKLGKTIENKNKEYYKLDLSMFESSPFVLYPDTFILAYTDEWVGSKANTNIAWQFLLKSTLARLGLDHNLAGWVEPGYFLPLCLELTTKAPLELRYGDLIGQAVFHLTTDDSQDYTKSGSYQKHTNLKKLKEEWKPEDILPGNIKNKFN